MTKKEEHGYEEPENQEPEEPLVQPLFPQERFNEIFGATGSHRSNYVTVGQLEKLLFGK
jgi:hypothetical protein